MLSCKINIAESHHICKLMLALRSNHLDLSKLFWLHLGVIINKKQTKQLIYLSHKTPDDVPDDVISPLRVKHKKQLSSRKCGLLTILHNSQMVAILRSAVIFSLSVILSFPKENQ